MGRKILQHSGPCVLRPPIQTEKNMVLNWMWSLSGYLYWKYKSGVTDIAGLKKTTHSDKKILSEIEGGLEAEGYLYWKYKSGVTDTAGLKMQGCLYWKYNSVTDIWS